MRKIRVLFGGLCLLIIALPLSALAVSYGGNSYNSCKYNGTDCPTSSTTTASTAGGAAVSGSTIDLDPFESFLNGNGKDTEVVEGTVLQFTLAISSTGGSSDTSSSNSVEKHTITINAIAADSVTITVASTPRQYTLRLNQPLEIDVDGDNTKDIGASVSSITPPTANIKFWKITSTPVAATTNNAKSGVSKWLPTVLAFAAVGLLLLMPRTAFEKIIALFRTPKHHDNNYPKSGHGLDKHIPNHSKHEGHGLGLGLPAHDFKSESGVVVNAEKPMDEMTEAEQKKIIITEETVEPKTERSVKPVGKKSKSERAQKLTKK